MHASSAYCRPCATDYERERRAENADVINARRREQWTPERHRAAAIRRYGLTVEQYDALREEQGNVCAICGKAAKPLRPDHDHACCPSKSRACGRCIRGLLCSKCNVGLGNFDDGIARLLSAADYLARATHGEPAVAASRVEVLSRADWDARAIRWSGASGAGLPPGAIYGPAPASPDGAVTVTPEWWRP